MYSSNHKTAFKSKWFVGSSNNNISEFTNNALANDTLILHPPERFKVGLYIISWEKPKPLKSSQALDSAVLASIYSNLLLMSYNFSWSGSSLLFIASNYSNNSFLSTSTYNTYSTEDISAPSTSYSTNNT